MKKIIQKTFTVALTLFVFVSLGQKTEEFKKGYFLRYSTSNNNYSYGKAILKELVSNKVDSASILYSGKVGTDTLKVFKWDENEKASAHVAPKLWDQVVLHGDIKIEKSKIVFYPWPIDLLEHNWLYKLRFKKGKTLLNTNINSLNDSVISFNGKAEKREYFIPVDERKVYSIPFRCFMFGVLTMPVKIFVSNRFGPMTNNVQFDVNVNVLVGKKYGRMRFYKLPNEETMKSYEKSWSISGMLGISKLDLSNKNTDDDFNEEYSIVSLSPGFAYGLHYKKAGLYFTTGIDLPMGPGALQWQYAFQPWLGFGLGLGIE